MQARNTGSGNTAYLGSDLGGNYIWCGAMNLAWNSLTGDILHGKLQLATNDAAALAMVDALNTGAFSARDLDEPSYYVRSGYGQATVDAINRESRTKFPGKTFKDLDLRLAARDIISYAYFLKQVEYPAVFAGTSVRFLGRDVAGFATASDDQRKNVRIAKYWSDDRFVIGLKLRDEGDELYLVKGYEGRKPEEVVAAVNEQAGVRAESMEEDDYFAMPELHLDHHRVYRELIGNDTDGPFLANAGFTDYFIAQMFENIRFDMDRKGARAEAEAVIGAARASMPIKKVKRLVLDKPFWVVMKRRDSRNPYLILGVNTTDIMKK